MISIFITFLLITKCSWSLPLNQLYPFGPDENDQVLDSSPDSRSPVFYSLSFDSTSTQELYVSFQIIYVANLRNLI